MKTAEELEEMFGITSERIAEIDEMASRGELPGRAVGPIVHGRPRMFGEPTRPVTFKETQSVIDQMDRRAKSLGMRRSDYLRALVATDLATTS